MAEIDAEISAYNAMREMLEAEHMGQWVLLYKGELIGVYATFDAAAQDAVTRFGSGPYLIRQVGAPPVALPASVMFQPLHDSDKMRI